MPEFTETVVDPTDGTEHTFTATTPEELEDKVHFFLNPQEESVAAPAPSPQEQALLSQLAELKKRKAAVSAGRDKAGSRYAGTPEGQAKIQRMLELATEDDPDRVRYQSWLDSGMSRLADEAEQRRAKDYRPEHQGPREPLPLPDGSDVLIDFVIRHRILGNYKVDDHQIMTGQTQATLYYMPPERDWEDDAADSVNVSYPAVIIRGDGVSLLDVIATAPRDKLIKLLGIDLGEELINTMAQV